ncbi:DUF721 domain-containing protein [Gilliamella sp. G0441]|uniref:DUF721 domain-containing protein n=1 Tax=Gilliamella sp. G0441 TaxID=3384760 RepID=UPI003D329952
MRDNEPQILTSILTQNSSLSQIKERISALNKLSSVVHDLLPSPLKPQCRVSNYRQGILIIEVSSASWLTRLKYEQSKLISGIRKKLLPSLSSIQYRINPDICLAVSQSINCSSKNATMTSVLTATSANYLYAIAENAPNKLKKQLIKLANHAK